MSPETLSILIPTDLLGLVNLNITLSELSLTVSNYTGSNEALLV
jgi:hypothetical protein